MGVLFTPFRTGAAHIVKLGPIGIEDFVPRSAGSRPKRCPAEDHGKIGAIATIRANSISGLTRTLRLLPGVSSPNRVRGGRPRLPRAAGRTFNRRRGGSSCLDSEARIIVRHPRLRTSELTDTSTVNSSRCVFGRLSRLAIGQRN